MTKNSKENQTYDEIMQAIQRFLVALGKASWLALSIAWLGFKRVNWGKENLYVDVGLAISSAMLLSLTKEKIFSTQFVQDLLPEKVIGWVVQIPWPIFCAILLVGMNLTIFFVLGLRPWQEIKFFQEAVDSLNLKTGNGRRPKVVSVSGGEDFRAVLISSYGVGPEAYKGKMDNLLSSLKEGSISSIERTRDPQFIEMTITKKTTPKKTSFEDLAPSLQESGQFLVGQSDRGIVTEKIDSLPHLLIAGTTGGGKSVFFKQTLLGLLESSESLQMHLIDLKGGLEFREFGTLPNVSVVKDVEEAVELLEAVKGEMERRFHFLEKEGKDKIVPKRDKFNRVVVGIDEASVLYSSISKSDPNYANTVKARGLTEHIAKLSRAASIHLVMATQRVTKETIDTRIQENISGRMCFKVNTLEGSLRVLGNKSACDLPAIPGRGIWQLGHTMVEVQTPYIGNKELQDRLKAVKEQYQNGEKKLHGEAERLELSDSKEEQDSPEDLNHKEGDVAEV